ncbi:hypothetical protein Q428_12730 [Fervidicella metallireducens AeB]|uniref:GerMN domain-containing protein n=1 Tax=Fervidicella metallireducens AeB TaxID=1403537 RepID=A0A017RS56_9CLOT|nr:GerMN domain-containing protein [Fervidicella metallireducens]EYE87558.1 hypothetical protein Q428_12730 [Fervidicella metallireducens AeB]
MKKQGMFLLFSLALLAIVFSAFYNKIELKKQTVYNVLEGITQRVTKSQEKTDIILYFPGNDFNLLKAEDRLIDDNDSIEKSIVNEIIKGPLKEGKSQIVSSKTKVIKIKRQGNTLTLNLTKDFLNPIYSNSGEDYLKIYSIVNSLTELPGIQYIDLYVENKHISKFTGYEDYKGLLSRNRKIIEKKKYLNPMEVLKEQMKLETQQKWLEAYMLMSDDCLNGNRLYFDEYVKQNKEIMDSGFINEDYEIGGYTIKKDKAYVDVYFYTYEGGQRCLLKKLKLGCIKIDDSWMVDWVQPE